jgi:hypothetical protein
MRMRFVVLASPAARGGATKCEQAEDLAIRRLLDFIY